MDIEYNKRKTKLSLPNKFSEFKELCIQTFYISESRSRKMNFYYVDEDNDIVNLDENSYENEDARKAKFWKLLIEEKKRKSSSNSKENKHSKKDFIAQKEALIKEAKLYKEKIFGECNRIIEIKIKQKNEEHKKDIQIIKDQYEKSLKYLDNKLKEVLNKISERFIQFYTEKSQLIEKYVIKTMSNKLGEFEDCKKLFEVNMGEIGDNINDAYINVKECIDILCDTFLKSRFYLPKYIIYDTEIENNINELQNNARFKMKIRKFSNTVINNSFLRIQSSDNEQYEDIKIDLSYIYYEETETEITFNPNISEIKKYFFNMALFNGNNIISNVAILIINVQALNSNDDLFD